MAIQGQVVQVAFVERTTDIDDADWRACFREPAEGLFWYRTLEACGLEDQFAISYARLTVGERIVGIAPCFLHDVPIALVAPPAIAAVLKGLARLVPRLGYQRTFFVGSPCSDEGAVGLVPDVTLEEVMVELREAVLARTRSLRASMTVLKDFPAGALAAITRTRRFFPTVSYPGTLVSLPLPDKEAYYRSLTHTHRHNLLKKLRRAHAVMELETRVVERPTDAELDEIFGLFQQTYEKGRTKFERLGPSFFSQIRIWPESHFILQRERTSGALVAFMLVFVLGDRVVNKFIGLDYKRDPRAALYFRLFDAALDFSYARSARELQSGQTGYRAKLDLGHRLVPLYNLFCHANPVVDALFRAVGRRVSWQSLDPDLAVWLRAHPESNESPHP